MCPEYPASRIRIPQVSSNRVVDFVLCRTCMILSVGMMIEIEGKRVIYVHSCTQRFDSTFYILIATTAAAVVALTRLYLSHHFKHIVQHALTVRSTIRKEITTVCCNVSVFALVFEFAFERRFYSDFRGI